MSILMKNNEHFFDAQRDVYKAYIKQLQNQSNDKLYHKKKPSDKITCIVCDGHYTRSKKCIHDKSKKHIDKLDEYYKKLHYMSLSRSGISNFNIVSF